MDETSVMRRVWLRMGRASTLFRINTGKGWAVTTGRPRRLSDGSIVLPGGRPISLGFTMVDGSPAVGTGDLVGWTPVKITPEMVGHTLPVFTMFETKESGGGDQRIDQRHFIAVVKGVGGIAAIVNSPELAVEALSDFYHRFDQKLL